MTSCNEDPVCGWVPVPEPRGPTWAGVFDSIYNNMKGSFINVSLIETQVKNKRKPNSQIT
jgi:translation elongation factor EF-4